MEKSTFTPLYDVFRSRLIAMRRSAGLTQRKLAAKLGSVWSLVEKIELGERRVDMIEVYWISKACGYDPEKTFAEIARMLKLAEKGRKRASARKH